LTKTLKAFAKAGVPVERAEIDTDGKITVVAGRTMKAEDTASADDELARWRGKRNANQG